MDRVGGDVSRSDIAFRDGWSAGCDGVCFLGVDCCGGVFGCCFEGCDCWGWFRGYRTDCCIEGSGGCD